jgi:hypothetical protein
VNRADLMLEVLSDGLPHSRQDIFAKAGCFFLTNNAASELRARGHVVEQSRKGGEFIYSLRDATEIERLGPDGSVASRSEASFEHLVSHQAGGEVPHIAPPASQSAGVRPSDKRGVRPASDSEQSEADETLAGSSQGRTRLPESAPLQLTLDAT